MNDKEYRHLKSLITMAAVENLCKELGLDRPKSCLTREMKDDLVKAIVDGRLKDYLDQDCPAVPKTNK